MDEFDDAWATRVEDYDYVIISAGNWFYKQLTYYEKHKVVGCSQCMEKNMTDLTMYYGYRRAFQTAFRTLLDLQNFKWTVCCIELFKIYKVIVAIFSLKIKTHKLKYRIDFS